MTAWFLKLHRWLALVFAVPLMVVLGTGLVLSFEPSLVVGSIKPKSLDAPKLEALLAKHDPQGQARALTYRTYDNTLTISAGRRGGTTVDLATGEPQSQPGWLARFMLSNRLLHEHFILDLRWMVAASSIAMIVLAVLGLLQGWPRLTLAVTKREC